MNKCIIINKLSDLIDLSAKWVSKDFAFDTEFTSLSYSTQQLIGISIYDPRQDIEPVFIQFNFEYDYTVKEVEYVGSKKKIDVDKKFVKKDAIDFEQARPYIQSIFYGAKCICANAKVEWKIFYKYGITDWLIGDDVNMMSWMLNVDTDSDLKSNAKRELGLNMASYTDTIKQKVSNIDWTVVDFKKYGEYGAKDAYATYMLRSIYVDRCMAIPKLYKCYRDLEIPLLYSVAKSEIAGIEIDVPYLQNMNDKLIVKIKQVTEEIYDIVGVEFNISSPKQLGEMLFDRLGYPVLNTSVKTGARSVNEAVLKELAFEGYEVAEVLLEYRQYEKIRNTYCEKMPRIVDKDNRLRGNLNSLGTKTGRFSSSGPNLQNIVNSKEFPIKKGFIARKGYSLINADWSTIEVRIMAHESRDAKLISLLNAGRDIHKETSDAINEKYNLSLTRSQGKTINFGVLYLMGSESLAYLLNKELKSKLRDNSITVQEYTKSIIKKEDAQKIIDGYFNTYTGFADFVKTETANSKNTGWVTTMAGRRRPITELQNRKTFGSGQRKVVNTKIQGGAGDLMKLAILKLDKMYEEKGYDATTLLYIHDEYVIEVREDQAERCLVDVIDVMENIFPKCLVPIKCEAGIYSNWAGLKDEDKKTKIAKRKVNKMSVVKLMSLKIIK